MLKPKAMIDYNKCHPEGCDKGVCSAADKCPVGILKQNTPWEEPYILQDCCVGCGKCFIACLFKSIRLT